MNKFWMILVVFGCKTIYGLENKICIVPSIPFGKAVQVDGPVLKVGQDYADFDSVKVQCDLGYAIILVRDTDNMVKCDFDQGWDKVFPTCQSKFFKMLPSMKYFF